uniref:RNA-directed DNA polymerase n=1 Tax=Cuerna arida TaxID=1464854 RepID=A0A1B6FC63_9HEMI
MEALKLNLLVVLMYRLRNDLQLSNGLVYYGTRLVVPQTLRKTVLNLLHETHLGSSKINSLVHEFYYWPGIHSDVHNMILSCAVCQKYSRSNTKAPLISHEIPGTPFAKIAADIAEINGVNYLIVIDYFSRWLEVYQTNNKNSSTIIKKFKEIFSRFGIPQTLIADNMPFNSSEMQQFAKEWKFSIITSSPYYPKSNGLAEKAVGIFKNMFRKASENKQDLELYLLNYRNAPVAGLQYSPSQLLNSRHLRTKMPVNDQALIPKVVPESIVTQMEENQVLQKFYYDQTAREKNEEFTVGQEVLVQNLNNKLWEKGRVLRKLSQPRSYLIKHNNGSVQRRNSVHLRKYNKPGLQCDKEIIQGEENRPRSEVQSRIITPSHSRNPKAYQPGMSRSGRTLRVPTKMNL